jgi:hypothetical protein
VPQDNIYREPLQPHGGAGSSLQVVSQGMDFAPVIQQRYHFRRRPKRKRPVIAKKITILTYQKQKVYNPSLDAPGTISAYARAFIATLLFCIRSDCGPAWEPVQE